MIESLKNAISMRLKKYFPGFTNYTANPVQNIKEPCFIIEVRDFSVRDLAYVPQNVREIEEVTLKFTINILLPRNNKLLNDVMTRALLCLKWLTLEDDRLVLTLNRSANRIDDSSGVITFDVVREVHIMDGELPIMKELEEYIGLKNE